MYSTEKSFAGQRATLGRIILVRRSKGEESPIEPAVITSIRPGDIIDATSCVDGVSIALPPEVYEARTAEDIASMPAGAWTWPPRV